MAQTQFTEENCSGSSSAVDSERSLSQRKVRASGEGNGSGKTRSRRANCDTSLGGVIAAARRRGGLGNVLKTLGMGKAEPALMHVNVGKEQTVGGCQVGSNGGARASQRTLGVSLLGACSSKGCPTKSEENEDRYVHGKIDLDLGALRVQEPCDGKVTRKKSAPPSTVPCWAFATFDGHAGPACAQFLKDHFMEHLRRTYTARKKASRRSTREAHASCQRSALDVDGGIEPKSGSYTSDRGDETDDESSQKSGSIEVLLARLLTDSLASLTKTFEKNALRDGEISGACAISGLYCQGALVLANIGDCQAVYHGQVKSAPGNPVTAQTTIHDATNPSEVNRFLMAGGFMSSTGRFQGVLEPSRTVGDVDVKADAPKGCIASYPELFKVDIASEVYDGEEQGQFPPFLVLATDGIWDETTANTVVGEVKDGIAKIQAHKRRFAVVDGHRRDSSFGSTTFTDGESDSEDEREFCGSGEWAERGMDLAERVVSLARGRYDDATALVVVFE